MKIFTKTKLFQLLSIILILVFLLSACNFPIPLIKTSSEGSSYPQAEVVFQASLPDVIGDGSGMYLEILDDVTGIYFNPTRFEMVKNSDKIYLARIPLIVGADINYRYIRIKDNVTVELNSSNLPVFYRRLTINGPELVQDSISGWADRPFTGVIGRIRGQIIDKSNQAPIPDLIITAAGLQTTSSADGTFILENVPTGTHNVNIFSKDGGYTPFQQYAVVSEEATTPIFIGLDKRELVKITFSVTGGDDIPGNLPFKIAGNISTLGDRFSLLLAGSGNNSSTLPELEVIGKGRHSITISLPAGAYIHYKYTLGDGFWNSELSNSGGFVLHDLIVPDKNTVLQDQITTFRSPERGEVVFTVTSPADTPKEDSVSIQFNPYDWMEPVPMVQVDAQNWEYTLYSPTHLIGSTEFRFCRNGDCRYGLSESLQKPSFLASAEPTHITETVQKWTNSAPLTSQPLIDAGGLIIQPRPEMVTGVELASFYPVSWSKSIENGLKDISSTGSKWVILTPTWSIIHTNPAVIEPVTSDLSWTDAQRMINYVKLLGLEPVLFPQIDNSLQPEFWSTSTRDGGWWQTFFDRYERYVLNYVDLAQLMEVKTIIIGDPGVALSMSFSAEADARWRQMITDIRSKYTGTIIGAISVPSDRDIPGWLADVDQIYVLFAPPVSNSEMITDFGSSLDSLVSPIGKQFNKPILIGLINPSNTDNLSGCKDIEGSCLSNNYVGLSLDLETQARVYNAAAVASFSRPWISGFISRGYYPYLKMQDAGSSIYGKQAFDILWFWYHLILNIST